MRFIEFNLKYQGFCIGPHYDNEVLSFSLCSYENGTKNVIKKLDYDNIGNYSEGLGHHVKEEYLKVDSCESYLENEQLLLDVGDFDYEPEDFTPHESLAFSCGFMCVCKNGKYGFIDENGVIIFPLVFDNATKFEDGVATVWYGNQCSSINTKGEYVAGESLIKLNIDLFKKLNLKYQSFCLINRGNNIIVTDEGVMGLIDSNQLVLFSVNYLIEDIPSIGVCVKDKSNTFLGIYKYSGELFVGKEDYDDCGAFSESFIIVKRDEKYGYLNLSSNYLIPCVFDKAYPFSNGIACVKKNGRYGCINMKGITTLSYQYDNPFYFEGNVARVKDHEGFYHLIDRKGKVLTDKKYVSMYPFCNGFSIVKCSNSALSYTFIDLEGEQLTKVLFSSVSEFKYNSYLNRVTSHVKRGTKYGGELDTNKQIQFSFVSLLYGKCIFSIEEYDWAGSYDMYNFRVLKDHKVGVVNVNGNVKLKAIYDSIKNSVNDGLHVVKYQGLENTIDPNFFFAGKISANLYDYGIVLFESKKTEKERYAVVKKGMWGVVDEKDKEIVPLAFDYVQEFKQTPYWGSFNNFRKDVRDSRKKSNFQIFVKSDRKYLYSLMTDELLLFDDIQTLPYGNCAFVKQNEKWTVVDVFVQVKLTNILEVCILTDFISKIRIDSQWYIFYNVLSCNVYNAFIERPMKFSEIRSFRMGLAAIKIGDKWGFINDRGSMQIQAIYDKVDDFAVGTIPTCTTVYLNGEIKVIDTKGDEIRSTRPRNYRNRSTYERYGGSYAQDEMGYSDDDIDTIFDGDPSAYWNID